MLDFRSKGEQDRAQYLEDQKTFDYKQAFEKATAEIAELKKTIAELKEVQDRQAEKLEKLIGIQSEQTSTTREFVETKIGEVAEDNKRLHAMIKAAGENDVKLIEQMDQAHRQRLESIMRLVDQKALPNG